MNGSLKDEADHVDKNTMVYHIIRDSLNYDETLELDMFVHELVQSYVDAEIKFLDLVFEMGSQEGLSLDEAKGFIKYLGNLRLQQLDLQHEECENPLEWIDYLLTAKTHTNFFEGKETGYSHTKLSGEVDYSRYDKYLEIA
jgi:ribonucleotide reductase beta subunit family protein with ferritin-like domain